jgi:hypothetical protein
MRRSSHRHLPRCPRHVFALGIILGLVATCQARRLDLDQYGGVTSVACPNGPKPHFYTQKIGDRWWLCDPAGHGFFMKGVANVNTNAGNDAQLENLFVPVAGCYGAGAPAPCCTGAGTGTGCGGKYYSGANNPYVDYTQFPNPAYSWAQNWDLEQVNRLKSWGFNSMADETPGNLAPMWTDSSWNTSDHTIPYKMPFAYESSTTAPAFSNGSGCGLVSAIKDMETAEGPVLSANGYDYGDYFDPHYKTCIQNQLAQSNQTYGLAKLYNGPNSDYFLYITIDESGQTGFLTQGPVGTGATFNWISGATPQTAEGGNYHAGLMALCTAPSQTGPSNKFPSGTYSDREVYSKVKFADEMATRYAAQDCTGAGTPFAACTGSGTASGGSVDPSCSGSALPSYCMGDTYIGATEMSNARAQLNAAWGSSYTTLSTSDWNCTSNVAECLIGNGACTGSGAPYSWCTGSGTGTATAYASWGIGKGLLDENGQCPSKSSSSCWVATDPYLLTGETAAMQADQSTYFTSYLDQYFSVLTGVYRADYPGILLMMNLGGYGSPARKEALQEAAKYIDFPQTNVPWPCPTCTDMQARIDFQAKYLGDHPWMVWAGWSANPDSSEWANGPQSTDIGSTQNERGQTYANWLAGAPTSLVNAADSVTGVHPVVGFYWWGLYDQDNEKINWGLLSVYDNPYDGKSATIMGMRGARGKDPWGYSTGGERANYGDFISTVTEANESLVFAISPSYGHPASVVADTTRYRAW